MKHQDEKTQMLGDFHPTVALFFRRGEEKNLIRPSSLFVLQKSWVWKKRGGEKEEGRVGYDTKSEEMGKSSLPPLGFAAAAVVDPFSVERAEQHRFPFSSPFYFFFPFSVAFFAWEALFSTW